VEDRSTSRRNHQLAPIGPLTVDGHQPAADGHNRSSPHEERGRRTRVLIAIRDMSFHQEVLDFFERDPRIEVVGAVTQPDALFRMEQRLGPDVVIVCPVLTREVQHPSAAGRTRNLLVVGEEMTVPLLRDSIDAGAKAVLAWPEERDELARAIAILVGSDDWAAAPRGRVVAVYGPRGGSGTTFIASHIAAALADGGKRCVLVDLDGCFADVSVALGIAPGQDVRTVADLVAVADELEPDHIEDALFRHPRGFAALLAPPEPTHVPDIPSGLYGGAVALLALSHDVVVLHSPRCLDEAARTGLRLADEVLLVVSPDLFSLYSARRAISALGFQAGDGRCQVVINPHSRGDISLADIEDILGIPPAATVRFDPAVSRFQDRGELLRARSRGAWRDVQALAKRVAADAAASTPRASLGGQQ
jgi:Flp pilus assembly CpaE family ATPase